MVSKICCFWVGLLTDALSLISLSLSPISAGKFSVPQNKPQIAFLSWLPARRYLAGISCRRVSVCPSVTRRNSIETAARIELIFCTQVSLYLCCAVFWGKLGYLQISPRHTDGRRVRYKLRQRADWCLRLFRCIATGDGPTADVHGT